MVTLHNRNSSQCELKSLENVLSKREWKQKRDKMCVVCFWNRYSLSFILSLSYYFLSGSFIGFGMIHDVISWLLWAGLKLIYEFHSVKLPSCNLWFVFKSSKHSVFFFAVEIRCLTISLNCLFTLWIVSIHMR